MRVKKVFPLAVLVVACWALVAAAGEMPADLLAAHEQMLYPVVRVTIKQSGGSGTLLYSEDRGDGHQTYVLTNNHVIDGAVQVQDKWDSLLQADVKQEVNDLVTVEIFRYDTGSRQDMSDTCRAEIIAHDKANDLALLRLQTPRKFDHTAKLLPESEQVFIFEKVWAVGCSLLHPPVVTEGIIDYLDEVIDRKAYWMGSANIIYGNSGGAVFIRKGDQHYFIGVPSRVAVSWGQAVTHMGFFAPIPRIREWFKDEELLFLLDPAVKPTECLEKREELRRKMRFQRLHEQREPKGEPAPAPAVENTSELTTMERDP